MYFKFWYSLTIKMSMSLILFHLSIVLGYPSFSQVLQIKNFLSKENFLWSLKWKSCFELHISRSYFQLIFTTRVCCCNLHTNNTSCQVKVTKNFYFWLLWFGYLTFSWNTLCLEIKQQSFDSRKVVI